MLKERVAIEKVELAGAEAGETREILESGD